MAMTLAEIRQADKDSMNKKFHFKKYTHTVFGVPPSGIVEVVMDYPDSFERQSISLNKLLPSIKDLKMLDDGTVAIIAYGTAEEIVL